MKIDEFVESELILLTAFKLSVKEIFNDNDLRVADLNEMFSSFKGAVKDRFTTEPDDYELSHCDDEEIEGRDVDGIRLLPGSNVYGVCRDGSIWSRIETGSNGTAIGAWKQLKPWTRCGNQCPRIQLTYPNKKTRYRVDTLVAHALLGMPLTKTPIHLNGDQADCSSSNLSF